MADIGLEAILTAPYLYAEENVTNVSVNEKTQVITKTISKSTKGYRILRSVYQEYISKGLLPSDFPVRTLKEFIIPATRISKTLQDEIFPKLINYKVLAGIKDYGDIINDFKSAITGWGNDNLSVKVITDVEKTTNPVTGAEYLVQWRPLLSKFNNSTSSITDAKQPATLPQLLNKYIALLENNQAFWYTKKY